MNAARPVLSLSMLLLAAYVIHAAFGMHISGPMGPGPGLMPLIAGSGLGLLAAAQLAQTVLRPAEGPIEIGARLNVVRTILIFTALLAVALLLNILGFRLALLIYYAAALLILGQRTWWIIGAVAFLGSFGTHFVLSGLLNVHLPIGSLGF